MLLLYNFDALILESYGRNDLAKKLTKHLLFLINQNIGKLIFFKKIQLRLGSVENLKFINDSINITLSNRNYGSINVNSYIIDGDQIKDLNINLELQLSSSELKAKRLLGNKIESIIEHEFLHLSEQYLTIVNNGIISKSWKMDQDLKILQNKYPDAENWLKISYFIYLSLPHELRARIQQLNNEIEQQHIKGIKNIIPFIKGTKIYNDLIFLSNVNQNILLDRLKLDIDYQNIISDFSKVFLKNKSHNLEKNFLDYIKKIKDKNKKMIDKLLRSSYNFESYEFDNDIIKYDYFKNK